MSITPKDPANFTPARGSYKELSPFRFWCQKVLPLVYDDSLSYYELLNKVVNYLNMAMEDVTTLEGDVTNLHTAYIQLQTYVNDYFVSLDVQEEINNKLDEMAIDGSLNELIDPLIPAIISAWLEEHITPTTPVIDNTFSIEGAGADSKTVGDKVVINKGIIDSGDANEIDGNTIYFVSVSSGSPVISNVPNKPGFLQTIRINENNPIKLQIYYPYYTEGSNYNEKYVSYRVRNYSGVWTNWIDFPIVSSVYDLVKDNFIHYTGVLTTGDLNDYKSNETYLIAVPNDLNNRPIDHSGFLKTYNYGNFTEQTFDDFNGQVYNRYYSNYSDSWTEWRLENLVDYNNIIINKKAESSLTDANDATTNTIYFASASGSGTTIANTPNYSGWLQTINTPSQITMQLYYPYNSTDASDNPVQYRTRAYNGNWTNWKALVNKTTGFNLGYITSGDLNDYVDIGELLIISNNTVSNTPNNLNISLFVKIEKIGTFVRQTAQTFDGRVFIRRKAPNNVWSTWSLFGGYRLEAIDNENTTEANATDMSASIHSRLVDDGCCYLSKGVYYVSGNIDMPIGSSLIGCGNETVIKLLSNSNNSILRLTRHNTVENIYFSGGDTYPSDLFTSDVITTRNGISFEKRNSGDILTECLISNCWFENFSGSALYLNNSGSGMQNSLLVNNCNIIHCKVGININYLSEYHKFNNVVTNRCYYGVVNNGGNNVFTNCTFHGVIGLLMDNSEDNKPNSGHGSAIGCTFNHIDNMNHSESLGNGVGIKMLNIPNGFVFSGCQLWYGTIDIQNCKGVIVDSALFGGSPVINVSGDYGAYFNGCIFQDEPVITKNQSTIFSGCYYSEDNTVIS